MPTVQDKQVGIKNYLQLDHVGADVDLSADIVTFSPALLRTMLEMNALGFEVMDQIHGAFDFTATLALHNRANSGLHTVFANYFQGSPPYWLSLVWRESTAAVGGTNTEWFFGKGVCGTIPGPNSVWNTVQDTQFVIRFGEVGIDSATDDATYTSIVDGTTVLTNIADAAPA